MQLQSLGAPSPKTFSFLINRRFQIRNIYNKQSISRIAGTKMDISKRAWYKHYYKDEGDSFTGYEHVRIYFLSSSGPGPGRVKVR